MQTLYTSGTVFHTFRGEKQTGISGGALAAQDFRNYKLPWYTISPTYSIMRTRLSDRTIYLSDCGKDDRSVQPYHGILPSGAELEWRKASLGIQKKEKYTILRNHIWNWEQRQQRDYCRRKCIGGRDKTLLFTTKTCPECKVTGYAGSGTCGIWKIDAEESMDLVEKYQVNQLRRWLCLEKDGIKIDEYVRN